MEYYPNNPPSDVSMIPGYIRDEMQRLMQTFASAQKYFHLVKLNVAPTKPRDGQLYYADGTNWNPGYGIGPYIYESSSYVPMFVTPQPTSGTYTPTLTNVSNLDGSTAYLCQYMRVGSVVTVSGRVDIDPTAAATSTKLGISLPIASNIGATKDCAGTAAASGIASQVAAILGDSANDRAQLEYISSDVTNQAMYFSFTYRII